MQRNPQRLYLIYHRMRNQNYLSMGENYKTEKSGCRKWTNHEISFWVRTVDSCLFLCIQRWTCLKLQQWKDRDPRGQMNPDVRACSWGGVHSYSSCFSLFKSSVASFHSIFSWRSFTLSSLFSFRVLSMPLLTSTECLTVLMILTTTLWHMCIQS